MLSDLYLPLVCTFFCPMISSVFDQLSLSLFLSTLYIWKVQDNATVSQVAHVQSLVCLLSLPTASIAMTDESLVPG